LTLFSKLKNFISWLKFWVMKELELWYVDNIWLECFFVGRIAYLEEIFPYWWLKLSCFWCVIVTMPNFCWRFIIVLYLRLWLLFYESFFLMFLSLCHVSPNIISIQVHTVINRNNKTLSVNTIFKHPGTEKTSRIRWLFRKTF
jgi:hypothetical protein